jgi:hypothetical protein
MMSHHHPRGSGRVPGKNGEGTTREVINLQGFLCLHPSLISYLRIPTCVHTTLASYSEPGFMYIYTDYLYNAHLTIAQDYREFQETEQLLGGLDTCDEQVSIGVRVFVHKNIDIVLFPLELTKEKVASQWSQYLAVGAYEFDLAHPLHVGSQSTLR